MITYRRPSGNQSPAYCGMIEDSGHGLASEQEARYEEVAAEREDKSSASD